MSAAEVTFWLARLGWLLAGFALCAGRPLPAAVGLMAMAPHVLLGPVVVELEPEESVKP